MTNICLVYNFNSSFTNLYYILQHFIIRNVNVKQIKDDKELFFHMRIDFNRIGLLLLKYKFFFDLFLGIKSKR